ncbi:type II toxin-antitoxin system RelE/ParE family toxin [Pseudomonas sp. NPDC007930]|uniref:type II toxin-antitoxin system RelE/ParE family toxin n=1 Tax=Pseudomonas sp. NPDC007930 TaxID=3364417 RepID=UPI0036E4CEF5
MPKQLALTDKALSDLAAVHEYYAGQVGDARACQVVLGVLETLERLLSFPGMGRQAQHPGVREWVFADVPYLAAYRVVGEQVQVLRVLHHRHARGGH